MLISNVANIHLGNKASDETVEHKVKASVREFNDFASLDIIVSSRQGTLTSEQGVNFVVRDMNTVKYIVQAINDALLNRTKVS